MARGKLVFTPILPANAKYFANFDVAMLNELEFALKNPVAVTLTKAEEERMTGWQHRPKIESQFTRQKTQFKLVVTPFGTNKRYWAFVSLGTKAKVITPVKAGALTIRDGYSPKTSPSGIFGGAGSYSGIVHVAPSANWPGVKARDFEDKIVKQHGKLIIFQIESALNRIISRYRIS